MHSGWSEGVATLYTASTSSEEVVIFTSEWRREVFVALDQNGTRYPSTVKSLSE